MTTLTTPSIGIVPSGIAQFKSAHQKISPKIAPYHWSRKILRWRADKHGGMFPTRMWNILKRHVSTRRPYFIAETSNHIRYVGDFHDIYPVVQLVDPTFQVEFAQWMSAQLKTRAGAYIDIGANLGILAASIAQQNPDRQIIAFEPTPETAARAAATFALNNLTNVTLFQAAVSDFDGTVNFSAPRGGSDRAGINAAAIDGPDACDTYQVPCITLDRLAKENQIPKTALIKIDVEGHEPAVIKGMLDTLKRDQPLLIFEYVTDIAKKLNWTIADITTMLHHAGYKKFHALGKNCHPAPLPTEKDPPGIHNILCE